MNTQEARSLSSHLTQLIEQEKMDEAEIQIKPILGQKIPFNLLDKIGAPLGKIHTSKLYPFLELIAATQNIGGWTVIGSALKTGWAKSPQAVLDATRDFIIMANVWHGCDNLGERVVGPALVSDFDLALKLLSSWREDENRWVRRALGVGIHVWSKRVKGLADKQTNAVRLFSFLEPLFEESEVDAVKGIGWGLKTLGRYFPHLVGDWLSEQIGVQQRCPHTIILRKAKTYLSPEIRNRINSLQ